MGKKKKDGNKRRGKRGEGRGAPVVDPSVPAEPAAAAAPPTEEELRDRSDVFDVFPIIDKLSGAEQKAWSKIKPHLLAHRPRGLLRELEATDIRACKSRHNP